MRLRRKTSLAPSEHLEVRVTVSTEEIASATGLRALITLPAESRLLGPPAFKRGSGRTGTSTLDCSTARLLDHLPTATTTPATPGTSIGCNFAAETTQIVAFSAGVWSIPTYAPDLGQPSVPGGAYFIGSTYAPAAATTWSQNPSSFIPE